MEPIPNSTNPARRESSRSQRTLTENNLTPAGYPRIPLNPRDYKLSIGITWTVLLIFNLVLPQVLYFALKYGAKSSVTVYLAVPTAIFGLVSVAAMIQRIYRLTKKDSFYRPLNDSPKKALDCFQWNFFLGYVYIAALIAAGNSVKNVRIVSMPLSLLILVCCVQIILVQPFVGRATYFCRMSSMVKGEVIRPALYTIIEDVVAVDGNEGINFRQPFDKRYTASIYIRHLLNQLSWLWGVSGFAVSSGVIAVIWAVHNEDVAWAVGWGAPFVWAFVMTLITFSMTKAALKRERQSSHKALEAGGPSPY